MNHVNVRKQKATCLQIKRYALTQASKVFTSHFTHMLPVTHHLQFVKTHPRLLFQSTAFVDFSGYLQFGFELKLKNNEAFKKNFLAHHHSLRLYIKDGPEK